MKVHAYKTPAIEGVITEILPETKGNNERGTYSYQPIIISWSDVFDFGGEMRQIKQELKVSLNDNVAKRIQVMVGMKIRIPHPRYVIGRTASGAVYQNVNANYIEVLEMPSDPIVNQPKVETA